MTEHPVHFSSLAVLPPVFPDHVATTKLFGGVTADTGSLKCN